MASLTELDDDLQPAGVQIAIALDDLVDHLVAGVDDLVDRINEVIAEDQAIGRRHSEALRERRGW